MKTNLKLYIAVLDEFPDYMTPTLVAHGVLGAHMYFSRQYIAHEDAVVNPFQDYLDWLENSFKKCVVRVNEKEFAKISELPWTYLGHENNTLEGRKTCAVVLPGISANVLKFAKLWAPKS